MRAKTFLIITFVLFIIISFVSLPHNPLINDDATMYAVAIRNTIHFNEWLAPLITPGDMTSFLDKPPLGIWLLSIIPKLGGVNEVTIHISNVVYYTLMIGFLYVFLLKKRHRRIALYSALTLATSMTMILFARTPKLDILIAFGIMMSHLFIFQYIKKRQIRYLYYFTISVAMGVLIKSGFAIIMPGLTLLSLIILNKSARGSFFKIIGTKHFYLCLILLLAILSVGLGVQYFAYQDLFSIYLKSIFIHSKYNTSYFGFGFNKPVILFMLISIFPWTPLFITSINFRFKFNQPLTLRYFSAVWLLSNFFFLLLFFNQTDIRTFTMLIVPMSILVAYKLVSIQVFNKKRLVESIWAIFFVLIFAILIVSILKNPLNASGFDQRSILISLSFFVISEIIMVFYLVKPNASRYGILFFSVCLSYVILFYQTSIIANAFNPYIKWTDVISNEKKKGKQFVIYRPIGRELRMSSDLCYLDFKSGLADIYIWQRDDNANQTRWCGCVN